MNLNLILFTMIVYFWIAAFDSPPMNVESQQEFIQGLYWSVLRVYLSEVLLRSDAACMQQQ